MKFDPTPLIRLLETIMFIFPCLILYVPIEVSTFFLHLYLHFEWLVPSCLLSTSYSARNGARWHSIQRAERGEWERSVRWVGRKIERDLAPCRVWYEDDWGRVRFRCTTSERKTYCATFCASLALLAGSGNNASCSGWKERQTVIK